MNATDEERETDSMAKKPNRRQAPRREIEPLEVNSITIIDNLAKVARWAEITEASTAGLLIVVKREDLVPMSLRRNLNIDDLIGEVVLLRLPQMNIEISGRIARTKFIGKDGFEIGLDYTDDAPEYWRECLLDLLPSPGELEGH